jgi:hypothetical protein
MDFHFCIWIKWTCAHSKGKQVRIVIHQMFHVAQPFGDQHLVSALDVPGKMFQILLGKIVKPLSMLKFI